MANNSQNPFGKIGWIDLTVPNAEQVRDFYATVTGWRFEPVSMGGYDDFSMLTADGSAVAGVCHKSGPNKNLPSQWLIYINVENLDTSMEKCRGNGGKILAGPTDMGGMGRMCVIEDPAGAVAALFEPA